MSRNASRVRRKRRALASQPLVFFLTLANPVGHATQPAAQRSSSACAGSFDDDEVAASTPATATRRWLSWAPGWGRTRDSHRIVEAAGRADAVKTVLYFQNATLIKMTVGLKLKPAGSLWRVRNTDAVNPPRFLELR